MSVINVTTVLHNIVYKQKKHMFGDHIKSSVF